MKKAIRQRLRIFNVAVDGFAFAINEEDGTTVFLSRQLCSANEVTVDDVSREIECLVGEGAKGPQAVTMDFVDEDMGDYDDMQAQIDTLTERVSQLEKLIK